jgi:hypothetical protein
MIDLRGTAKTTRSTRATSAVRLGGALAVALGGSCTVVTTGPGNDASVQVEVPARDDVPPVKLVDAQVLFVMNLEQSSANLANNYSSLAMSLMNGLGELGVSVVRWAVVPTYPGQGGVRLVYGGGTDLVAPSSPTSTFDGGIDPIKPAGDAAATPPAPVRSVSVLDMVSTLEQLAASGQYDGPGTVSEAEGTVDTGQDLIDARLPPEVGGLDGAAFFDRPHSLFLVVYLQPLSRRCNLTDPQCQVGGRSPADLFTAGAADGTASWLRFASGGMPIQQVVHASIATKEGETADAFRARCGAVNGFPKALFDVMEPSTTSYFVPLMAALNGAHPGTGQSADLCDLLGEQQDPQSLHPAMNRLVSAIAAMAGPEDN